MSIAPVGPIDATTLPQLMLVDAKLHLRVDFDFDDALIVDLLARAIAEVEAKFEVKINPGSWTWSPASTEFDVDGLARCPVTPIGTFVATIPNSADPLVPIDVSADVQFTTEYSSGAIRWKLSGYQGGLAVAIVSGYSDPLLLPAELRAEIFETVMRMYDYRNIVVTGGLDVLPEYQNLRFAPWWNPKA